MSDMNGMNRTPVEQLLIWCAERKRVPSLADLNEADVPQSHREKVLDAAELVVAISAAGEQQEAKVKAVDKAQAIVSGFGPLDEAEPADPLPDNPRDLAALVHPTDRP